MSIKTIEAKVLITRCKFSKDEYKVYQVELIEGCEYNQYVQGDYFTITGYSDELDIGSEYILKLDRRVARHDIYGDSYRYISAHKLVETETGDKKLIELIHKAEENNETKQSVFKKYAFLSGKTPTQVQNRWYRYLKGFYDQYGIECISMLDTEIQITNKVGRHNSSKINELKDQIVQHVEDKLHEQSVMIEGLTVELEKRDKKMEDMMKVLIGQVCEKLSELEENSKMIGLQRNVEEEHTKKSKWKSVKVLDRLMLNK